MLELNREKNKVRTSFIELRVILTVTENRIMKQLNDTLSSYNSYTTKVERMNERKRQIENIRNVNLTVVPTSPNLKIFHDKILQDLNQRLKQLRTPVKPKLLTFVCDNQKLLTEMNMLCKLVERVSEIDYTSKTQSIISVCDRGTDNERLSYPSDITVDHNTGNIYVADCFNDCVKVFDRTAKYLYKFGNRKGEGKISCPRRLLIRDNTVFLSQNHCVLVYQLDGKFFSRIGSYGSGELQFHYPWGLSTDESNNDVYVCDHDNNRIQIISENLQYKSEFGKDILRCPRDVKLSQQHIYVLDESNPCIHVYNYNHVLIKSMISWGKGNQITNSLSFSTELVYYRIDIFFLLFHPLYLYVTEYLLNFYLYSRVPLVSTTQVVNLSYSELVYQTTSV